AHGAAGGPRGCAPSGCPGTACGRPRRGELRGPEPVLEGRDERADPGLLGLQIMGDRRRREALSGQPIVDGLLLLELGVERRLVTLELQELFLYAAQQRRQLRLPFVEGVGAVLYGVG